MDIKPYKISTDETILDDLKMRLKNTRWPGPVEGIGWEYGADYALLKPLILSN